MKRGGNGSICIKIEEGEGSKEMEELESKEGEASKEVRQLQLEDREDDEVNDVKEKKTRKRGRGRSCGRALHV